MQQHQLQPKRIALACAVMCLSWQTAYALSLGPVSVTSGAGEALRAQVRVLDATPMELAELKVRLTSADSYNRSGDTATSVMSSLKIEAQNGSDGTPTLLISSEQALSEHFLDVALEADWPEGKIKRTYTLLIDSKSDAKASDEKPVKGKSRSRKRLAAAQTTSDKESSSDTTNDSKDEAENNGAKTNKRTGRKHAVHRGETAGAIAAANKPGNVSVDRMLVALLRANPHAFLRGNVNRLKSGAVLTMPTSGQIANISESRARRTIVAQSNDFNGYRRQLAGHAGTSSQENASRSDKGKVNAKVADGHPSAGAVDRLNLSKGAVKSKAEETIANQNKAKDDKKRNDELSKNVKDLKNLAASAQKKPDSPIAVASASASPASQATSPSSSLPGEGFFDNIDSTTIGLGALGLLAALGGWGWLRSRRRKEEALANAYGSGSHDYNSAYEEAFENASRSSTSNPASATIAGGAGPNVHAANTQAANPPIRSTPNASASVDPLIEADHHLSQSRYLQAEEVLKDALRMTPERLPLREKLLEVYAKRGDKMAFSVEAQKLHSLTQGQGEVWARVAHMGRQLDPAASMFREDLVISAERQGMAKPAITSVRTGNGGSATIVDNSASIQATKVAQSQPSVAAGAAAAAVVAAPIVSYDLSKISLDVNELPKSEAKVPRVSDEALATKLTLAKEFLVLGNPEGARTLAQEVLNVASGSVREQAQKLIATIDIGALNRQ